MTCGSNVRGALVGRHSRNERVVVTERRHQSIGLKDLGGTEISDTLFLESWLICGNEYDLLVNTRNELILDALFFPPHSKDRPEFIGDCESKGQKQPDGFIGVLNNAKRIPVSANVLLTPTSAWRIDENKREFVQVSIEGLSCSTNGIITVDSYY